MARLLPNGRQVGPMSKSREALAKNIREFSSPAPRHGGGRPGVVTTPTPSSGTGLRDVLDFVGENSGIYGAARAIPGGPPVKSNWDYLDAALLPVTVGLEAAGVAADPFTGGGGTVAATGAAMGLRTALRRGLPILARSLDPGLETASKAPRFIGRNWNRTGDLAEQYVRNAINAIPKIDDFGNAAAVGIEGGMRGVAGALKGGNGLNIARGGLAGARSGLAAHRMTMMNEDSPYFQGETETFDPAIERQISGIGTPRQPRDKPWVDVSKEIETAPKGVRPGPLFRLGRKVEGKWRQPTVINNVGEGDLPNLGPDEVRSLLFGGRGGIIDVPGKDNPLNNMNDIMRAAQGTVSGVPIPMEEFRMVYEVPHASEIKRMMEGADAGAKTRRADKRKKLFNDVQEQLASGKIDSNEAIRRNAEIDRQHPEWIKNEYSMKDARKLRDRWIQASQEYEKTHGVPLPWKVEGRVGDTWQSVFTQAVEHGKPVDKGGKGTIDELTIIPDLTNSSRSSNPWADWSAKHPEEWQAFIKSLYGETRVY